MIHLIKNKEFFQEIKDDFCSKDSISFRTIISKLAKYLNDNFNIKKLLTIDYSQKYNSIENIFRDKLFQYIDRLIIKPDQILTCEHHTTIHIELYNGTPITNEISLVSNAKDIFPFGFIENERKNATVDRTKFTQFVFEPIENNTIITYEIKLDKSGPVRSKKKVNLFDDIYKEYKMGYSYKGDPLFVS